MNYRNRRIFERYSWTERGNAYMLDDEAPPVFACLSQRLHRHLPGAARLGQLYRERQPCLL